MYLRFSYAVKTVSIEKEENINKPTQASSTGEELKRGLCAKYLLRLSILPL